MDVFGPIRKSDGNRIITGRTDQQLIGDNLIYVEANLYLMDADGSNERKVEFQIEQFDTDLVLDIGTIELVTTPAVILLPVGN